MSTAGDGVQAPPSSGYGYGGGGVGGKFDKRSSRRNRANPYDRPTTALRNPSWVSKLLVDPAKKLIASSANVFFSSVFRKNPPPPLSLPVSNPESSDRIQDPVLHDEGPLPGLDGHKSGVLELEELLKQKSFTRSEIDRLTDLLRSKAVDLPAERDVNRPGTSLLKPVTDAQKHQEYQESPLAGKGLKIERYHGLVSTPGISSRVLDEDIASPTELAKAYMDRLPSKVSPSTLSWRSQSTRNDEALLSNSPFTPAKNAGHFELGKNGFMTPSSRGRSAIYNMTRTPYSRAYPSTSGKVGGPGGYRFRSPSLSVEETKLGSKKCVNSVLDDLGSGGPMRRIRQRNGLMSDKVDFTSRGNNVSKEVLKPSSLLHKHSFMNDWNDTRSKNPVDKVANGSNTSSHVHPRCSEVAAKILQQLENISPKEKSIESKLNASGERSSPSKLTNEMIIRRMPNNLQNAGSSKMSSPNRELAGIQECTFGFKEKEEQNGPQKLYFQREMNGDAEVSTKRVFTGIETSDSAAQQSPKLDSMINAHEGSSGLAGETCRNGLASQQLHIAKSTKDKNPVVVEPSKKTSPEPVFGKASNLRSFSDGIGALPLSTAKVETVKFSPLVSTYEKQKKVEESSSFALAGKAPDMKAPSSFSFGNGTGLFPQVGVSSKHDDDAKLLEKTKPLQFGTYGSSTSSSTPAFSIFNNSKLLNNGTASISSSSSPLISTDFTNQAVTNFASSASGTGTSSSVPQPSSSSVMSISPASGGSAFGSGTTTGSSIFGSSTTSLSNTDPSHSQGTGKESISGGSTTVSQGSTTPFQFGSSTSSPIFGTSGLAPFTFGATTAFSSSSSSSSGQTCGLSSTIPTSGASNIFGFAAATIPHHTTSSSGASSMLGFSSGSLTTSSVSSLTSSVTPVAFDFGGNNNTGSLSSNLSSRLSTSTDNSSVVPGTTFNLSFSSSPVFSFGSSTTPMLGFNQSSSSFHMNTDDSMAEDTLQQSSNPMVPVFGGGGASSSGFTFHSTVQSSSPFQFSGQPSQSPVPNSNSNSNSNSNPPFQFSGQSSQGALQNSPFQGTGSLEFNGGGGGSFVFGSGGGEKSSGRKIVKVNRNKHRKK